MIKKKNLRTPGTLWSEVQLLWEVVKEMDDRIDELEKVKKNGK